jgi:hypothetical protein
MLRRRHFAPWCVASRGILAKSATLTLSGYFALQLQAATRWGSTCRGLAIGSHLSVHGRAEEAPRMDAQTTEIAIKAFVLQIAERLDRAIHRRREGGPSLRHGDLHPEIHRA